MMSILRRMSRFNGSIFFMSCAKRVFAQTHGRACTRRSEKGTEKNVQSSREQATGDEEGKKRQGL